MPHLSSLFHLTTPRRPKLYPQSLPWFFPPGPGSDSRVEPGRAGRCPSPSSLFVPSGGRRWRVVFTPARARDLTMIGARPRRRRGDAMTDGGGWTAAARRGFMAGRTAPPITGRYPVAVCRCLGCARDSLLHASGPGDWEHVTRRCVKFEKVELYFYPI